MNKQRGFTIIELIVVIAIIAVLAAIVLVNVTTYINKAKDARINSDVGTIKLGMAGCFAAGNGTTYVGCNANLTYVPAALLTDITTLNSSTNFLTESTTTYVFCAKLVSTAGGTCIDATGVTKAVPAFTSCAGNITVCP